MSKTKEKEIILTSDEISNPKIVAKAKLKSYNLNSMLEVFESDRCPADEYIQELLDFIDRHHSKKELDLINKFWNDTKYIKEDYILLVDLLETGRFAEDHVNPNNTDEWCKMFEDLIDLYIDVQ